MAKLDGKTPEQIAAEIIEEATKTVMIEISGVAAQNLETILRYKYSKKIYSKGEKWFQLKLEDFQTEWLESIIEAQYKQREKLDAKQAEADKWEYANILQARGFTKYKAMEMAGLISESDIAAQKVIDDAAAKKSDELKAKAEAEAKASAKAATEAVNKK